MWQSKKTVKICLQPSVCHTLDFRNGWLIQTIWKKYGVPYTWVSKPQNTLDADACLNKVIVYSHIYYKYIFFLNWLGAST